MGFVQLYPTQVNYLGIDSPSCNKQEIYCEYYQNRFGFDHN